MKAVLCHALGEPDDLRVEETEPSHLEHGQVRIGVRAAGVNFPDYLMVTGKYQVKPPLPFTPGIEAAGEIIECAPDVVDLRPGQRVVALARRGGAFASQLTLPAPFVVPIPDTMDFATATENPAAVAKSIVSGIGTTNGAGRVSCDANAPPRRARATTRCPGRRSTTSGAHSMISPAASMPGVNGKGGLT